MGSSQTEDALSGCTTAAATPPVLIRAVMATSASATAGLSGTASCAMVCPSFGGIMEQFVKAHIWGICNGELFRSFFFYRGVNLFFPTYKGG